MDNPCYNRATKTDCPNRHCGCASDCSKWAEYVLERNKEYQRRRRIADARDAVIDSRSVKTARWYRNIMKDRLYKSRRKD